MGIFVMETKKLLFSPDSSENPLLLNANLTAKIGTNSGTKVPSVPEFSASKKLK